MKRPLVLLLTCKLMLAAGWATGDPADLAAKDVFQDGFPQFLVFRGEMSRPKHRDYTNWSSYFASASGVIRKFVREELPDINPDSPQWADRYAVENPGKLMMLHLNGEARQVLGFPDVHARYFPGHWVHLPGCRLTASVGPEETVLQVQDAARFTVQGYLNRNKNGGNDWEPQHVVLVHLDEQGNPLWAESEYAIVKSVDQRRNTITVQRGAVYSKPLAHTAGKTYVAPMAGTVGGGKTMWYYNLSSACPKDSNGRTAADVFAAEIAGWLAPTGQLHHFNGVAFDVNYFQVRDERWDVDNDGHSDGGFVRGKNVWQEGDWSFLRQLRALLGDDRLITADGQHPDNQRAVGVLDGIESEGLVQHNDGFRGFSRAVNTHLYWSEYGGRRYDFRYVVLKLTNPNDEKRGDQLRRFATGTACCLGAQVARGEGDFLPPAFAAAGSLGQPAGPLLRPARQAPDLLSQAGAGNVLDSIRVVGGTMIHKSDGVEMIAATTNQESSFKIVLSGIHAPPGDLTFFVEMEALEPLEGFAQTDRVPRLVRARLSPLPDYGEGRANEFYSDLSGYIGTHGRSQLGFYFRRPNTGKQDVELTLEIQGRGRVKLTSLTAHNHPDVLARAFERGVVVVNPALSPSEVLLGQLFPGRHEPSDAATVPALDAVFLPLKKR